MCALQGESLILHHRMQEKKNSSYEDYIVGQRLDRFPECSLTGQKGLNTVTKRIKRLATQYGTMLCIRKLEWVN